MRLSSHGYQDIENIIMKIKKGDIDNDYGENEADDNDDDGDDYDTDHSKVVKAVAGFVARTIAWLALTTRLVMIMDVITVMVIT